MNKKLKINIFKKYTTKGTDKIFTENITVQNRKLKKEYVVENIIESFTINTLKKRLG